MAFDDDRAPPRQAETLHAGTRRHDAAQWEPTTRAPCPPAVPATACQSGVR